MRTSILRYITFEAISPESGCVQSDSREFVTMLYDIVFIQDYDIFHGCFFGCISVDAIAVYKITFGYLVRF